MFHTIVRADHVCAAIEQNIRVTAGQRKVVVDVAVLCITGKQERECIASGVIVAFLDTSSIRRPGGYSQRIEVGVGIAASYCVSSSKGAVASGKGLVAVCI